MKEPRDYAELAARFLRSNLAERRPRAEQRDRGIGSVAQAMVERGRRKRLRRAVGIACAAAAVAALATAGVRGWLAPADTSAACAGECDPLIGRSAAASYPPGSHIVAAGDPVEVAFGGATRLLLQKRSELVYRQAQGTRRFRLLHGSVRLQVEKLAPGQRFIVETPTAEVEVRGTSFEVALVETGGCEATRVRVSEGLVEARASGSSRLLKNGESWEAGCDRLLAVPPAPEIAPPPPSATASPRPQAGALSRASAAPAPAPSARERAADPGAAPEPAARASSLAQQNELYARAVAARNSGRSGLALESYAELLARFPGGPLAESAMIERVRILAASDRPRAAQEARRYLSTFPHGFAREEAEALAGP